MNGKISKQEQRIIDNTTPCAVYKSNGGLIGAYSSLTKAKNTLNLGGDLRKIADGYKANGQKRTTKCKKLGERVYITKV